MFLLVTGIVLLFLRLETKLCGRRDLAERWHAHSPTLLLFLDSFVHRVTKTGANFSVVVIVTGLLCVFNSIKCGSASVFALCVSKVRLSVTVALNHRHTGNTLNTHAQSKPTVVHCSSADTWSEPCGHDGLSHLSAVG